MDLLAVGSDVLRLGVGTVILVAGWAKAQVAHGSFAASVASFGLLPPRISSLVARLLPAIEVAVGVALVLGVATPLALSAAFALLAIFTLALCAALIQGRDARCGCFGSRDQLRPVQIRLVVRNAVLLAAVACALAVGRVGFALDALGSGRYALEVTAAFMAVSLAEAGVVIAMRRAQHAEGLRAT